MRIPPIDEPRGPVLRFGYWLMRRQLGKVPDAFKVIYGHAPHLAIPSAAILRTMEKKLALDPELKLLVTTQSSLINGCAFCADLHEAQAIQARMGMKRFRDLPEFRTSPHFSASERAALTFTEEMTRERKVSDATFEALRAHFDQRQIVELAWLCAIGNFYNLEAVALGLESDGLAELAERRAG
jgi:AhpD family alkylhydroperoxidase